MTDEELDARLAELKPLDDERLARIRASVDEDNLPPTYERAILYYPDVMTLLAEVKRNRAELVEWREIGRDIIEIEAEDDAWDGMPHQASRARRLLGIPEE